MHTVIECNAILGRNFADAFSNAIPFQALTYHGNTPPALSMGSAPPHEWWMMIRVASNLAEGIGTISQPCY